MPIRAILFDKDGTLVDIQLTLGPATCDVLWQLSGGDQAMFARLAELTRVDTAARRLMPGCPVISEATDVYGRTWAQALGRAYTPEFGREIDRLFLETTLEHLQPIGDPRAVLAALARARLPARHHDQRCRGQHAGADAAPRHRRIWSNSSPATTPVLGRNPMPRRSWRLPRRVGVAPNEIAVVGDSPHDLIAARAAGAVAVGVLSGPNGAEVLAPHADAAAALDHETSGLALQ